MEMIKVLEELVELFDVYVIDCGCFEQHLETNPCKHQQALTSAISYLQAYEKLKERLDVGKILAIAKTCKTSLSGLRTLEDISQAIVNFLKEGNPNG